MNGKTTTVKGYVQNECTALFVEALQAYTATKDFILNGLIQLYGEKVTNDIFNDDFGPSITAVDNVILQALGLSIRDNAKI